MAENHTLHPGPILHQAIAFAFKSNDQTIRAWCRDKGYSVAFFRSITHGLAGGQRGRNYLEEIISSVDRSVVESAYSILLAKAEEDAA